MNTFNDIEVELISKRLTGFPDETEIAVAKIVKGETGYFGIKKTAHDSASFNNSLSDSQRVGSPLVASQLEGFQSKGLQLVENGHHVFEIGSVTKVFNCAVLASLVERGLLQLDTSIEDILGFQLFKKQTINLRQLATHTSGLSRLPPKIFWDALFNPSNPNPYKDYTQSELLEFLQNEVKLKSQGKVRYSNFGAGILATVMQQATQMDYQTLLQTYLFEPYGMNLSHSNWRDCKGTLVPGLNKKGQECLNWDFDALAGAGSAISSVSDLVKFVLANFDGTNKHLALQRQCQIEGGAMSTMALGWIIVDSKRRGLDRFYFHNGGTGGYSSAMLIDMKEKNAVIVLSNISGMHKMKGHKITNLAFDMMRGIVQKRD